VITREDSGEIAVVFEADAFADERLDQRGLAVGEDGAGRSSERGDIAKCPMKEMAPPPVKP